MANKDALIALANGDEVEWTHFSVGEWHKVPQKTAKLQYFLDDDLGWKFRLKPRTITINGIEVPCNKSKHDKDDVVWVISTACENWYDWIYGSDCDSNTLYWETEEEIKQVVAALRQVFGGGK